MVCTAYDMNPEMEKYFATNKYLLTGIGAWPYQHKVLKVLILILIIIVHNSTVITQLLLLYDTWGDIDILIECTVVIFLIFGASVKLINIAVNNNKFRRLLQLMNEHWEIFNSDFERNILRYYINIGQKVRRYIAVYLITVILVYLLIPLIPRVLDIVIPLNESRPLAYVYQAEYRMDNDKYYYLVLLHSYITSLITIILTFTIDTTYIMYVLHACSLFTVISQRLEIITGEADTKLDDGEKMHYHVFMEKHSSGGNDYSELMICLKIHQLALESVLESREILSSIATIILTIFSNWYVQTLDSMFTHVTFILLFLTMLILSGLGIQLIISIGNIGEVIRYLFIISSVFVHLICMCIPSQLLINRSTEVFDKAYGSAWYTFSTKTRRLLRVLLYRSLTPCTLTAGKMFIMSMTMCSSVMQTAMSYFTAFLSLR